MGTRRKQPELAIQEEILEWLNAQPGFFFVKWDSSGYFDPKIGRFRKRISRFSIPGNPDIIGWARGTACAFEVKAGYGKPTDEQKAWHAAAQKAGAVTIAFVWSLDDVKRFLLDWGVIGSWETGLRHPPQSSPLRNTAGSE